jgi:poly(A)-specific ribonuclease
MIAQIFVRRIAALLNRIRPTSLPRKAMDITIENFSEKLPYVETSIHDAIFVSIDGEFTGLSLQDQQISNLDTLEERYAKTRNSTTKFLMVQFGLCTFHYDSKKNSYSNRAFNFYLWPKPFNRQATDKRFICQTSSIDFLSQVSLPKINPTRICKVF